MQEEIGRKTIRIEADGGQIGQVNGLSVISLGTLAFGQPSRITAQVRLGRGEVVDIEREVELGGPLHSKGVLILRVSRRPLWREPPAVAQREPRIRAILRRGRRRQRL